MSIWYDIKTLQNSLSEMQNEFVELDYSPNEFSTSLNKLKLRINKIIDGNNIRINKMAKKANH